MFGSIRPLVRIASELRRIANVMEYFATEDARRNSRIFLLRPPRRLSGDDSELLHTDRGYIEQIRREEAAAFLQHGYPSIEEPPDETT